MKKLKQYIKNYANEIKLIKQINYNYNHFDSIKSQKSIGKNGEPIPWFTYPAIDYLKKLNLKDKNIFEWGCGNSSLFWSGQVKQVVSVEDNKDWFNAINKNRKDNLNIHLARDKKDYIEFISTLNKNFDIIVIDGKYRKECCDVAIRYLNQGGLIILDNSERYPDLCKKLCKNGSFIQVDFDGFGPINTYVWETSFFLPRDFDIQHLREWKKPLEGRKEKGE